MSDSLQTYLEDHLAGAAFAMELLETIRQEHAEDGLSGFAARMLEEVKADRSVLEALAERIGTSSSEPKAFSAWLAEKLSRLKLRREAGDGLGTFEALEFLTLGIQGKQAMWRALGAIAPGDSRFKDMDFDGLLKRAETQREEMELRRIEFARQVFLPARGSEIT